MAAGASAVIESGAAAGADTQVSDPVESGVVEQPVEGGEQAAPETDVIDQPEDAPDVEAKPDVQEDGRAIPAEYKELFKTNPKLKDAWFTARAYRQEFPGGIKEAKELKQTFSAIGGNEGLEAIKTEIGDWQAMDKAFMDGDPRFVEQMASGAPEAFAKHAPAMLDKYADIDPEGYQRAMGSVMANTFQNAGIPMALWKLEQCMELGRTDEAKKLVADISSFFKGVDDLSKSKPKAKEADPLAAERQKLADQEAKIFNDGIASDFKNHRAASLSAEIAKYTKGAQIDPEKKAMFEEQVMKRIAATNDADPNFKATMQKYYQAKDREGLLKFIKSRFDAAVPKAVETTHKLLPLGAVAAKKPAVTPAKVPAATPAPKGWVKVGGTPKVQDVDRAVTTNDMLFDKTAVLKNGQKVYWGTKVPA